VEAMTVAVGLVHSEHDCEMLCVRVELVVVGERVVGVRVLGGREGGREGGKGGRVSYWLR